MFDVFYSGSKPNLFAHERAADSIEHAQQLSRTRYFWWVNYLTDYTGWDFLWEPVPWEAHQRHAWPSQWQRDAGTYLVPKSGFTDTNYRSDARLIRLPDDAPWRGWGHIDPSWHPDPTDPPLIYQFGTQHQKTGGPTYVVPGAADVKYVAEPRVNKTTVDANWAIPTGVDTNSFDFTWHPDATDPPYIYQFGTQHQRTGGPRYTVPGATDIKFVDQIRIRNQRTATHVYVIDHMEGNAQAVLDQVDGAAKSTVRYFDNYLDTLRRIAKTADKAGHEFVWVIGSICDYADFDWTWHPEQWQAGMLHVFASNEMKFGDTFFMHVPTFAYRADGIELLDWYDVNYIDRAVPRRAMPVLRHEHDSHVDAVKRLDWAGPLALFATPNFRPGAMPTVPLWREKVKTVVPLTQGAAGCIVPKVAVPYIKTQLYDYPNIDRTHRSADEIPIDIVFIENGETNADYNWSRLPHGNHRFRIHRSSGVKGRVAAYQAAADLSLTPWFFAVFAKLEVDTGFDWTWQPDRLQQAKHYIFHARNPVNGLEYGHQAMIAYNRRLVLANSGRGLDFTLDDEHEVVPILSGIARYADTPWMAWRTAFRECIKLKCNTDVESQYRLGQWLKQNNTNEVVQYSHLGAQDAVEYYDSVGGDIKELRNSYDWAWLASYVWLKRGLVPD